MTGKPEIIMNYNQFKGILPAKMSFLFSINLFLEGGVDTFDHCIAINTC